MADTPSSQSPSRGSTPNPRFTLQAHTTEDLLKEQTVGLVHLSDFKKRRAEVLEQSRDSTPVASGAATPDGRETTTNTAFKKRKKPLKKGGLSFGNDDEEQEQDISTPKTTHQAAADSKPSTPARLASGTDSEAQSDAGHKKRLKPNSAVTYQPKAMTKSALLKETQLREQLRKEYAQLQDAVKETEFCLPFVFFNGKPSPGGLCRMKKGDFVWAFLERTRKVGADMAEKGDMSKKDWARIGVDDLMLVRGDLIIQHHYDFHYFLVNKSVGYNSKRLFPYSAEPTSATPRELLPNAGADNNPEINKTASEGGSTPISNLTTAAQRAAQKLSAAPDHNLEGFSDDPGLTKVVDRRWYERNKHIFPASSWEDFDPNKDYSTATKKDVQGNAFFFSR